MPDDAAPIFNAQRLLYVGTGSIGAAFMPFWVNWLRMAYPDLAVRVMVTRSAERFVSRAALAPISGDDVFLDAWPDAPVPKALHVELAEWPDVVIVHPASMSFVARYALGICDTPALLALQCTDARVVVAPGLPPGATGSPTYRQHRETLRERHNVAVVDPVPGRSTTTGRFDACVAAPLPHLIEVAERLRTAMAVKEPK